MVFLAVAALIKDNNETFKTLFEADINLKRKHDNMSAEAKTICHQNELFFEHKHYIFRR